MTMDFTLLKTQRKSFRTSFTVCAKKSDDELLKEAPELTQLSILKSQISDKFARLETCQAEITNLILKTEDAEQAYEDFLSAEKYREYYIELCSQIEQLYLKDSSTKDFSERRKFKLPKIELKKFDGDAKNYLSFWSQFRKIHEDSSIPNEDKFQYLLQAVVPKSKAARVVESFPATADNYQKAISQLQERFGRNDLLVQIYVRDLLTMVMKNAATGRSKTDLPALYDELEAKIRALESLGRTQEKYGDFLSPLVESCLPEEVLVAWERSRNHSFTAKESRTFEQLMNFLRQEVKGEEMVNLARTGFASNQSSRRKELHNDHVKQSESTTASALVSLQTPENPEELIPLTPSMFLIENRSSNTGDIEQLNSSSLNKRIKYRSKLLKDLRQRFRKEYLGQLVQKHNEKHSRNPQVGEIVLVEIYSNQSVDKEPGGEESNSHDVSDNKNKLLPGADDVIMRKYTSSGRYVKAPKRLDLLNNVCYVC
ncbi:hypothetical protein AVEN_60248-1 [Araneus ventricosus]|uniref:Uncharacterized protein n=1 Tax=Araneus ventricosus TaxID=182803 RepID=A0A4Y2D0U9_ARAVE|nr:hypothetical protein AVEN_60248-1 [Araneus ventricosus]